MIDAGQVEGGYPPLYAAALGGHLPCVQRLLSAGALVNMRTAKGFTPLCIASQRGRAACVERLLAASSDIGLGTPSGFMPLHAAASEGQTECVQLLLNARADSTACFKGASALDLALKAHHKGCCHSLLRPASAFFVVRLSH